MDILQLVKGQLTTAAISRISNFLEEDTADIISGLSAGLPAILAGFMRKASTIQGAGDLLTLINNNTHNDEFSSDLAESFRNGQAAGMISSGGKILRSVFGDKLGMLEDLIGNISGIKANSSALLGLATSLLTGVLGKKVKEQGLGVSGFASLLMKQKEAVKEVLPAGIGSILSVDSLGNFAGDMNAKYVPGKGEGKGIPGGLLPWLLLALLILGGLYFWKSCQNKASEVATVAEDSTETLSDSAETMILKTLSTGVHLSFPEQSIENELISFIENKEKAVDKETWFNFRKLTFESGSAVIDSSSEKEVDNIAEILKAYPQVSIKVGGYTDNTGSNEVNTRLSAERAANVVAGLIQRSISSDRLESEGYGPLHPVADNATEEGRNQNRRIAVRVTAK